MDFSTPDNRFQRILRTRGVWLRYPAGPDVVRGADIEVFRGKVTMILGRSGSGKTTLLRGIAGLIGVSQGVIAWNPDNGNAQRPRLAYIPQTLGLVRSMTALENTLVGALRDVPGVRSLCNIFPLPIQEKAKKILVNLGLADKIDTRVSRLSGGQRQRVAIARALIQDPGLILADEFVSQLDAVTTEEILIMMRELAKKGISFLVTTHDTELVKRFADRVIVMNRGKIDLDDNVSGLSAQDMLEMLK
jgi:phosphonate transport system ATP-binding protein